MDTGASSHLTADSGKLHNLTTQSHIKSIFVGNGHDIPVMGTGNTTLLAHPKPLALRDVLYTHEIIKNLVSVRKFTIDNSVSVEFDPDGFTLKDLQQHLPF